MMIKKLEEGGIEVDWEQENKIVNSEQKII